jgi:CRISPR-associated endoribonuclease Cas6
LFVNTQNRYYMRFRLILAVDRCIKADSILPINYQYELSSWIYKTINSSDSEFASWLHNAGYIAENRKFKLFTFSNLKPAKYKIAGDRLIIESENVELTVSFFLPETVEHFITGLFRNQTFHLGDKISSVGFIVRQIEKQPDIEFTNTMYFRTISPMIISKNTEPGQKYAQYLSPEEIVYGDLLVNNLVNKYVALAEKGQIQTNKGLALDEVPIGLLLDGKPRQKLIKIKAGNESETFLKGYLFSFRLSAPIELIRIGYYGGFGEKNSLGFGCCEVMT